MIDENLSRLLMELPAQRRILIAGVPGCNAPTLLAAAGHEVFVSPRWERGANDTPWPLTIPLLDRNEVSAIVVFGVNADVDLLHLFEQAFTRLQSSGHLYLLLAETTSPHQITGLRRLATRCGFESFAALPRVEALRKAKPPTVQLSIMTREEVDEVGSLFERVFHKPLFTTLWPWKYGDGRGGAILARKKGRLCGHAGGLYRRISCRGRLGLAMQPVDVMVDASERSGEVFQATGCAMQELCLMWGQRWLLAFGIPSGLHMEIGERMGLYAEVDAMTSLHWVPLAEEPCRSSPVSDAAATAVDHLWGSMQRDLSKSIVGVRDFRYIKQRYLDHPTKEYAVFLVSDNESRASDGACGLIVLRAEGRTTELLDLVGPISSIPLLIEEARRRAHHSGSDELYGWTTLSHRSHFDDTDYREVPIDIRVPMQAWGPGAPIPFEEIRNRWWLMSGDADFR